MNNEKTEMSSDAIKMFDEICHMVDNLSVSGDESIIGNRDALRGYKTACYHMMKILVEKF